MPRGGAEVMPMLPHRGAHDVGVVVGLPPDGVYVPRASWTETADSPLRHRSEFDVRQFMVDEERRHQHQSSINSYFRKEVGRQLEGTARSSMRQTYQSETEEIARAADADVARMLQEKTLERQELHKTQQIFRSGLDKQAAEHVRKAQEQRLEQIREAAEVKLRTVQALCKDITEQAHKKQVARNEAAALLANKQDRNAEARSEKLREVEELRNRMELQALQDENRFLAQQGRINAAQAHQDAVDKYWGQRTGKEQSQRLAKEEQREDRDERRHQKQTDLYYAKREAARERQRLKMVQTLSQQVGAHSGRKTIEQLEKQAELEIVLASTWKVLKQELSREQGKKAEELELQNALVQQMAEKQSRLRASGIRLPVASSTMAVTPALLASAAARSPLSASAGNLAMVADLTQRVDAAKYLAKPLGNPEVKPWVDITRSVGLGGVVGVFSGEGATRSALASTGGIGRLLTTTAQVGKKDRCLSGSWSEGVASRDLRAGARAAAKRAAASAADKCDPT